MGLVRLILMSIIHLIYDKQLKELTTNQGRQTVSKWLKKHLMSVFKIKLSVMGLTYLFYGLGRPLEEIKFNLILKE